MTHKTEKRQDGYGNIVTETKYNHLAAAEMMKEDNYNQIDGVLNNTSKPTFTERMAAAKIKAKEHNNRKGERHKDTRHDRKSDRHREQRKSNNER